MRRRREAACGLDFAAMSILRPTSVAHWPVQLVPFLPPASALLPELRTHYHFAEQWGDIQGLRQRKKENPPGVSPSRVLHLTLQPIIQDAIETAYRVICRAQAGTPLL